MIRPVAKDARRVRATLEMDLEGNAPTGVLSGEDGTRLLFSGWVELASVIEQWRAAARGSARAEGGTSPERGGANC
jgi:hypothetical protein